MITKISDEQQKYDICRDILRDLPDWFGIEESIDEYARRCRSLSMWADLENGAALGFIALRETSPHAAEVYVMGVRKGLHRRGIGRKLFAAAYEFARDSGCEFLHVKTVRAGMYPDYDRTNAFYKGVGFRELECLPELWDELNPCQIYVMSVR